MIACVLRMGGIYRPEHVQRLAKQAAQFAPREAFVCLSDVEVPGVVTVPLQHGWPGWWSKLELFRPGLWPKGARVFYADLDTTFVANLGGLLERPESFLALADFTRSGLGSGLMQWTAGDQDHLYELFAARTKWAMDACGIYGDQRFIQDVSGSTVTYWQDVLPGQVVSYKVHCKRGVPKEAAVVCFHGKPKPWQVAA